MERTFALIQGTSVVNSIIADDSFIDFIKNDYTKIIETTGMDVKPGIGAAYDEENNSFIYPHTLIDKTESDIIDVEEITPTPEIEAPVND